MDDRRQGCRAACERTGDSRGCPKLCLWTRPLVRWHTRSSGRTGGYRLDNRGLALCPESDACCPVDAHQRALVEAAHMSYHLILSLLFTRCFLQNMIVPILADCCAAMREKGLPSRVPSTP